MTKYKIVPLTTEQEMDEKGYVHWKTWQDTYSKLMPKEYLDNITLEKCVAMAHRWNENTLLLKANSKVVGFSCFGESKDTESANEIIALYLLQEYHGLKLGYSLLNATLEKLPKDKKTVLWVLDGNEKAIGFYKRFGFDFTGNVKTTPFGKELQMFLQPC